MARDGSLQTWNVVKARFDNDLPGGEADKEAQAREQYYQFEDAVITALNGDPRQGVSGVLQSEANLRRLIGMPQSDARMIRPAEVPSLARTIFDWDQLMFAALESRSELRAHRHGGSRNRNWNFSLRKISYYHDSTPSLSFVTTVSATT